MTVDQRITPESIAIAEGLNKTILPGQQITIELNVMETEHPHTTFPTAFKVYCAPDDSHGTVTFFHPEAGFISKDFSGDSKPFYLIETSNGIGLIEWEHKPKPKVET